MLQRTIEWCNEAERLLSPFAACSDPKVARIEEKDIPTPDLAFPEHTNARLLANFLRRISTVNLETMRLAKALPTLEEKQ